jgi:ubiquinone/menaquinone biosynthesis C-methylase UbiE
VQDYGACQSTPFWRAADRLAFAKWAELTRRDAWLLDIGSAGGRSSFQWTDFVEHVVGFDISKMIQRAIGRARAAGLAERATFLVADADRIPVKDAAFDYACTYGVLHHVPSPDQTLAEVARLLRPGGIFFASENNKSAFRGLFDVMMKLVPLWTELAGEEPVISAEMVQR